MEFRDSLFKHAKRRLIERYGVWIDIKDYNVMNQRILKRNALFLGRESFTRTHWLLDEQYIAVFHSKQKRIVTFLPPEAIDNYLPFDRNRSWLFQEED